MRDWKKYFEPTILERAHEYFAKRKVEILSHDKNSLRAIVKGSQTYRVEVSLDRRGELDQVCCECPHFDSGANCKHIAAALFAWEEALTKSPVAQEVAQDSLEIPNNIMEARKIYSSVRKKYIHGGGVDYPDVPDFAHDTIDLLKTFTPALLKQQKSQPAFRIWKYLLCSFVRTPMDDDGDIFEVCLAAFELLADIYMASSEDVRQEIFDWVAHLLLEEDSELWVLTDFLEEFLDKNFQEEDLQKQKSDLIATKLKMIKAQGSQEFGFEHNLAVWLKIQANHLQSCGRPASEIERLYLEYWDNYMVRQTYIQWLIEAEHYEQALDAAKKSLRLNQGRQFLQQDDYKNLLQIYQALNDLKNTRSCLIWLITHGEADQYYMQLKNSMSKSDWAAQRLGIINQMTEIYDRAQFLAQERLMEELFAEAMNSEEPSLFYHYATKLSKIHPQEVVQRYVDFLDLQAQIAGGRKYYQELGRRLRQLAKLPDGLAQAQQLLQSWRQKYANRRAMLEELAKVKI